MYAAVLMVAVRSAVEVAAVWVPMHMAFVAVMPRSMHPAVLVMAMAVAVEVTSVRISMHMTMMVVVVMPTVGLVQKPLRGRGEQSCRCCLCRRSGECQRKDGTHQCNGFHDILLWQFEDLLWSAALKASDLRRCPSEAAVDIFWGG